MTKRHNVPNLQHAFYTADERRFKYRPLLDYQPAPKGHTPLNVPYAQRATVKALGAHWDPGALYWYVMPGMSVAPFTQWLFTPVEHVQALPTGPPKPFVSKHRPAVSLANRLYLFVPKSEQDTASKAGARFDPARKCYYVAPNDDLARFTKWPRIPTPPICTNET